MKPDPRDGGGPPMMRHCGSFAASPVAQRSEGSRGLRRRRDAQKAPHAACRGVEESVSVQDTGATSATLIDYYGSRVDCWRLLEATPTS